VRAHLGGRPDGVTTLAPVRERYPDFTNFLSEETDAETLARLLDDAGFGEVRVRLLAGTIVALHTGAAR
jgi:ubiquinone/menaquinone biosynthesis C-methylase UbiE